MVACCQVPLKEVRHRFLQRYLTRWLVLFRLPSVKDTVPGFRQSNERRRRNPRWVEGGASGLGGIETALAVIQCFGLGAPEFALIG